MKEICSKNKCTGCSACANKCPKHCIIMGADDGLGHVYPVIDQSKCVNCGLCEKVCPANKLIDGNKPLKAYAAWDKIESEYISSTSGGAASAISRSFIKSGGVVYGCTMLPGVVAKHIRISTVEETYKLKGSKYVQSNTEDIYRSVLNDIKSNIKILFIGTPCQIAAVKNVVGKSDDLLYTIDIICHGVPSLKYLQDCSSSVVNDLSNVIAVFRNKNTYQLGLKSIANNEYIYLNTLDDNRYEPTYINNFFNGFTIRNSCHNCSYAKPERISDLTVGDFWGLGRNQKFDYDHPHGCSVLLPNTSKGKGLVKLIKEDMYIYERPVEEAILGNDKLRHPTRIDKSTSVFLCLYKTIGIKKASRIAFIAFRMQLLVDKIIYLIAACKRKIFKYLQ